MVPFQRQPHPFSFPASCFVYFFLSSFLVVPVNFPFYAYRRRIACLCNSDSIGMRFGLHRHVFLPDPNMLNIRRLQKELQRPKNRVASCIILPEKTCPGNTAFPSPAKKIPSQKNTWFSPLSPCKASPFPLLIPIKFLPLETFLSA